jgi:hypothetical protein
MSPLLLLCLLQGSLADAQALQALPQTWSDLWPFLQAFSQQATEFLSGVPIGLQGDLAMYSPCVLSYLALAPHWDILQQVVERSWQSGSLATAFDVLQAGDEFLTAVVSSGQRCEIWLLFHRLASIFTLNGLLSYAQIAYLNQEFISVTVTQENAYLILADLYHGYYQSAGIGTGQVLSQLLPFSF